LEDPASVLYISIETGVTLVNSGAVVLCAWLVCMGAYSTAPSQQHGAANTAKLHAIKHNPQATDPGAEGHPPMPVADATAIVERPNLKSGSGSELTNMSRLI
jgi:hypothetical protein